MLTYWKNLTIDCMPLPTSFLLIPKSVVSALVPTFRRTLRQRSTSGAWRLPLTVVPSTMTATGNRNSNWDGLVMGVSVQNPCKNMQKSCNIHKDLSIKGKNLDILRFLFLQSNLLPVDHDTFEESRRQNARPPFIDAVRRMRLSWRFEKGHR
jgi:hypothetical protein